MANILITGANGEIGRNLVSHLKERYKLRLADISFENFPYEESEQMTLVETDLTERKAWDNLLDDIDYVIHMAANPSEEATFDELIRPNYFLPQYLYEAAEKASSLKRIIFASSIHAVDAYPLNEQVKTTDATRPNDLYGVSKVYMEGLAQYHSAVNGIESIGIRIANYRSKGNESYAGEDVTRMVRFLSERDMNHLVDCCLEAELKEPYLVVNGISANVFPRLDYQSAADTIGYKPQDNVFEYNPEALHSNQ